MRLVVRSFHGQSPSAFKCCPGKTNSSFLSGILLCAFVCMLLLCCVVCVAFVRVLSCVCVRVCAFVCCLFVWPPVCVRVMQAVRDGDESGLRSGRLSVSMDVMTTGKDDEQVWYINCISSKNNKQAGCPSVRLCRVAPYSTAFFFISICKSLTHADLLLLHTHTLFFCPFSCAPPPVVQFGKSRNSPR